MRLGVNTLFLIPEEVGGTEIYVRSVLPELLRLDPALEMTVFTNAENHETFADYARERIGVRATSRPRRILAEQTLLPRALRRLGIDLLYSPGYTAPLRARCAQVVTIHDTQFLDFPEDVKGIARWAHRALVGGAARAADAITTVSRFSASRITHYLGVAPERIFVAHSSLSGVFTQPQPCAQSRPFLLYVANTYPHKNAARLVEAFALIADRIPHDLVFVGQPREGEPPAHPRVHRIHYIPYLELVGLFQAADLLVFPSLYEGFGRPVVEAMEAGTRVIAAHAGSIPEIGGEAATYFDGTDVEAIAEAILAALNEPAEERARRIEQGKAWAKRYTWEDCARQTFAAFDYALERRKRARG